MSGVKTPEGTGTTAASGVVTGLATLCVALRFYTRIRTKAQLSWDDWFILVGLFLTLLTAGLLVWGKSQRVRPDIAEPEFTPGRPQCGPECGENNSRSH